MMEFQKVFRISFGDKCKLNCKAVYLHKITNCKAVYKVAVLKYDVPSKVFMVESLTSTKIVREYRDSTLPQVSTFEVKSRPINH